MKNIFYKLSSFLTLLFANKYFYRINKVLLYQSLRHLGYLNDDDDNLIISGIFNNLSNFSNEVHYVLDIGGHHGKWSLNLLNKFNVSKIYIVEANKYSFKILKENIYKNNLSKKCIAYNKFLDKEKKKIFLYDTENLGSTISSKYKESLSVRNINNLKQISIETDTLDNLVNKENIKEIDLIKIDCEGNELNILEGGIQTLIKLKPKLLLFENNYHSLITGSSIYRIKKLLNNYKIYRLLPNSMIEIKTGIEIDSSINLFSNYLAILSKNIDKS